MGLMIRRYITSLRLWAYRTALKEAIYFEREDNVAYWTRVLKGRA